MSHIAMTKGEFSDEDYSFGLAFYVERGRWQPALTPEGNLRLFDDEESAEAFGKAAESTFQVLSVLKYEAMRDN
jgi:hypothetical protein